MSSHDIGLRNGHTIYGPEIVPREGTWQAAAHAQGQRFYGSSPNPELTGVEKVVSESELVAKAVGRTTLSSAVVRTVEIGSHIELGYN
jgi:hypothetical protein